jgi:hypothetical protein
LGTSDGTLALSAFGSFTVGGHRVEITGRPAETVRLSRDLPDYVADPNGAYSVGHAYVQYFIPAAARGLPVIDLPGDGGQTRHACHHDLPRRPSSHAVAASCASRGDLAG